MKCLLIFIMLSSFFNTAVPIINHNLSTIEIKVEKLQAGIFGGVYKKNYRIRNS